VEDSGIGLKEQYLEIIFQPFEQVDNSDSRRLPGTGLGLSLTKRLMELHGGQIGVESKGEGRGSSFHFLVNPRASRMPTVTVTMPIQAGKPGISCRIGMAIRAATTGTAERNTEIL